MKWTRRFFSLGLVFVLLAGVSCTTDNGPTAPPEAQSVEQPAYLLGDLLGVVGGTVNGVLDLTGNLLTTLLNVTGLLSCQEQQYAVTSQTVGPQGGTIRVGKHTLVIPRGALSTSLRIHAEQMRGPTNSVRFSPEGLQFQKPAVLTLNYQNCRNIDVPKAVVYTTDGLVVREILQSLDILRLRIIAAPIDHFSRYAVAY
jgi:hypothetical protein